MLFTVRLSTPADVPALEALIPLSVRSLQSPHYTSEQMDGALGTVFAVDTQLIEDGTFYVAQADGILVGCGGWSRRKTMFGGNRLKSGVDSELDPKVDAARIRAFFIKPGWERRGIGSAIMRCSETAAISQGFQRIDIVATWVGELLYLKFGYAVVERSEIPLANGHSLPVVRMTKNLRST